MGEGKGRQYGKKRVTKIKKILSLANCLYNPNECIIVHHLVSINNHIGENKEKPVLLVVSPLRKNVLLDLIELQIVQHFGGVTRKDVFKLKISVPSNLLIILLSAMKTSDI